MSAANEWVLRFKQPDFTYLYYVTYPGVTPQHPSGGAPPVFSTNMFEAQLFLTPPTNLKGGDIRFKDGEIVTLAACVVQEEREKAHEEAIREDADRDRMAAEVGGVLPPDGVHESVVAAEARDGIPEATVVVPGSPDPAQ